MKICGMCNIEHKLPDFPFKNGKSGRRHSYCVKCLKEYKKLHYQNNKEKWRQRGIVSKKKRKNIVNKYKSLPCSDCNQKYQYYTMQFDHLTSKKFGISAGVKRYSIDKLLKEISKCEVVCANCHLIRTKNRHRFKSKITPKDRRRQYMRSIKTSSPCLDCDQKYPYFVMQFDHLSNKKFIIGKTGYRVSLEVLKIEIAKCDIVCANCHTSRSYQRQAKSINRRQ